MDATVHSGPMERDTAANALAEEPIGRLDADRLCPRCLHQLSGQPVLREVRLDFLFVRCPECGINAPVTEHPATGRWLRRLGGLVAAVLVLMLVGFLALDVLASTVGIYATTWEATRTYEGPLQQAGAALSPGNQNNSWLAPSELRADRARLDAIGRDREATDAAWERLRMALVPLSAVGIASGILWTLLLAHRRWYLAWLWLLVPHGLAIVFSLLTYAMHRPDPTRTFVSYADLAYYEYGPRFLLTAVGFLFAIRLASFLLMRPLLILMAKALLPNKLLRSLRAVWFDAPA